MRFQSLVGLFETHFQVSEFSFAGIGLKSRLLAKSASDSVTGNQRCLEWNRRPNYILLEQFNSDMVPDGCQEASNCVYV